MRTVLFLCAVALSVVVTGCSEQEDLSQKRWGYVVYDMPEEWYGSEQAKEIADNVVRCQMENGGWVKNQKYQRLEEFADVEEGRRTGVGSTIDNGATTLEMKYLERVYSACGGERYRDAYLKALNFLFDAQYENGGWPQFYPVRPDVRYSACITYNDDAMVNVLNVLKDVWTNAECVAALAVPDSLREKAREAYWAGIDCVLATQIRKDSVLTVWCAQHDEETLAPAKARAYELPSFSGAESVRIVELLMDIEEPSVEVVASVCGAVEWFKKHEIRDSIYIYGDPAHGVDAHLEYREDAGVWGRFIDLDTERPFFCDRDGVKRERIDEIGGERRNGYAWYSSAPQRIIEAFPEWKRRVGIKE